MRIAIPFENGQIFQHFGQARRFKVYDAEGGEIQIRSVVSVVGIGHGALAGLLQKGSVDVLICGSIGAGARRAMAKAGIAVVAGHMGEADGAAEKLLAGQLEDLGGACAHTGEHRQ